MSESGYDKGENLIRVMSRSCLEAQTQQRGENRATAIFATSLEYGNKLLEKFHVYTIFSYLIFTYHTKGKAYIVQNFQKVNNMIFDAELDMGIHEKVSLTPPTEIGVLSMFVPKNWGKTIITWEGIKEKIRYIVTGAGNDIAIKGLKGVGKTDLACLLGEITIEGGDVFASNIPIAVKKNNKYFDKIKHINYLSDLLRLRLEIPVGTHITVVIDEAEPVFKKILGNTLESRNIIDFFNLTRKYDISIISIWHFEDEIPNQVIENTKLGNGLFFKKEDKKKVQVYGNQIKATVIDVPRTNLGFVSTGLTSTASFYVDLNINKLNQQTTGLLDPEETIAALKKALDDELVYLPQYKHRAKNKSKIPAKDSNTIIKEILENMDKYVTSTGRSIRWRKIKKDYGISENDAKDVRDEILSSEKFQNLKNSIPDLESSDKKKK